LHYYRKGDVTVIPSNDFRRHATDLWGRLGAAYDDTSAESL